MVNALSRVSYDMREVTEIALQELCTSIEERKERGGQQKGFYLAWQAPTEWTVSLVNHKHYQRKDNTWTQGQKI